MGFLYTTAGTQFVLDTLNTAFDRDTNSSISSTSTGLGYIRYQISTTPRLNSYLRGRGFQLNRLARILQIYPVDQDPTHPNGYNPTSNARWIYFLRHLDNGLPPGTPSIHSKIRDALADAILTQSVSGVFDFDKVAFSHVEITNIQVNPSVTIFDTSLAGSTNGPYVRNITLQTVNVGQNDTSGYGPPDNGEPPQVNPPWKHG